MNPINSGQNCDFSASHLKEIREKIQSMTLLEFRRDTNIFEMFRDAYPYESICTIMERVEKLHSMLLEETTWMDLWFTQIILKTYVKPDPVFKYYFNFYSNNLFHSFKFSVPKTFLEQRSICLSTNSEKLYIRTVQK